MRQPADEGESHVSTLELFFDLVFVFTITQLTTLVEHHLSVLGVVGAGVVFIILFWMYGAYAWLTNQVPPTTAPRRLLLICGMAAFLICAMAIPRVFDGSALLFAVGYTLVVLVHSGLYAETHGRAVCRFVPFNVVGAACLVIAAFLHGWERYALWVATLALHYMTARVSGQVTLSEGKGYDIRPAHFVERHGDLLIIVFGESIVAIGVALAGAELSLGIYGAAILGLAFAAALWWLHFGADPGRSEAALAAAPLTARVRLALAGYFYAFIPMLFGIVILAAGLGPATRNIGHPLMPENAMLLGAGTALYLAGTGVFRLVFGIRPVATRLAAAAVAVATALAGVTVTAFLQVVLLIATGVVLLLVEAGASPDGANATDARNPGGDPGTNQN